jgi:hypothetical protein
MAGSRTTIARSRCGFGALLALIALCPGTLAAVELDFGGDARLYAFLALEDIPDRRNDSELGILRLKLDTVFSDEVNLEVHGVVQASSPPLFLGSSIATGGTRRYFDLETTLIENDDLLVTAELDRLFVRWDRPGFRLVAGRQAITWGVAYLWPVLDLFAPFAPQRIDRDYKPGVDAVRVTVPLGDFSEVDLVAAGQGQDLPDDFSAGGLARFNAGTSDFGVMAGSFHTDTVVGGFVTTDVEGTGLRGEVSFTESGDSEDSEIDRERFVRATVGVDRQLTATLTLTAEAAWNGYGADDPSDYPRIAVSDRVQRGEVNSLGRSYAGVSLAWQVHPLVTASAAVLGNLGDSSVLIQPTVSWSVSNTVTALFGLFWGVGDGLDAEGRLQSEYGAAPTSVWASIQAFF